MPNQSKTRQESDQTRPPQTQDRRPGRQHEMEPRPRTDMEDYRSAGKLTGKAALVTGGDSGIGQAVAAAFAQEGADVAFIYLEEDEDAGLTRELIEEAQRQCVAIKGDIGDDGFCKEAVEQAAQELGQLDILVNNAGEQHPQASLLDITKEQLERTFRTNLFSIFFLCQAALPHLKKRKGGCIINTASVTAYRGAPGLLDYSATKGGIVSLTRSLSGNLAHAGADGEPIRVNAVAPGPIWTPLIPSTFPEEQVRTFGSDVPLGRPGEPEECAGCYVFLASDDASYMTGQVLHPNGGEIVNG